MSKVTLGSKPLPLTITLARGGSFTTTLKSSEDYPLDIVINLQFYKTTSLTDTPIVWPALILDDEATWDLDPEDVTEVITGKYRSARLHYVEADGSILVWGSGEVDVV